MKYKYSDSFLINHLNNIKKSIENDVGTAIRAYSSEFFNNGNSYGFFAVPRLLFPEIDGLGSYLTGKTGSCGLNIKTYFQKILSKIDRRYFNYAILFVAKYRHGLLHQHDPKVFNYKHKEIGWIFSISNKNNPLEILRKSHLEMFNRSLQIDMNVFYNDVIKSIDLLVDEIKLNYKKEFIKSINEQYKPITKYSLLKRGYTNTKDFIFLKNI